MVIILFDFVNSVIIVDKNVVRHFVGVDGGGGNGDHSFRFCEFCDYC